MRRLQEYERFKRAAEDIDKLERLERDNWVAGAELKDRKVVKLLPQVTLQEMLARVQGSRRPLGDVFTSSCRSRETLGARADVVYP